MTADLDALVRRVDEDRWLASRFAPAPVRARLIALYAVNYEIARTAESVTQEGIGDIRLAWWREAIGDLYRGAVRPHPAIAAYARAVAEAGLPQAPLDQIIEARGKDLDARPFETWDALDAYLDATAGNLIALAIEACGESGAREISAFTREAGRAWGYAGLLRAEAHWRARGRSFYPRGGGENAEAMRERARHSYAEAKRMAPALPGALFPAFGYAALVPRYLKALAQGRGEAPLIARQFSLIAASATGRL